LRARFAFIREFNYNEPPSGKRKKISVPFEATSRLIDACSPVSLLFSAPTIILPTKLRPPTVHATATRRDCAAIALRYACRIRSATICHRCCNCRNIRSLRAAASVIASARPVIGPSLRAVGERVTRLGNEWYFARRVKNLYRLCTASIVKRYKGRGRRGRRQTHAGQDKEKRRRCRMVECRVSVQTHLTLPLLVSPFSPFCPPVAFFARVHRVGLLRFHACETCTKEVSRARIRDRQTGLVLWCAEKDYHACRFETLCRFSLVSSRDKAGNHAATLSAATVESLQNSSLALFVLKARVVRSAWRYFLFLLHFVLPLNFSTGWLKRRLRD